MRTCLALFCVLVLLASPLFLAYLEAERLLVWRETPDKWLEPWLSIAAILAVAVTPTVLLWIGNSFVDSEGEHR